jgi:hypothetical protein
MAITRRVILCIVSLAASILPAPAAAADLPGHRPILQEIWARTELYFGTAKPGGEVSDAEFTEFVDRYVTPRFPDGLTLLTGYGQFLNSNSVLIKERSKVLILLYPFQTKGANRMVEEIRSKYKELHAQESVLRVDSYAAVSF